MPQLPTQDTLGAPVVPQSGRNVSSYQSSQVANAVSNLGESVQQDVQVRQAAQDKLEDGFARSHLTTSMIRFAKDDENNPDVANAPSRWDEALQNATKEASGMFSNKQLSQQFVANAGEETSRVYAGFLQNVDTKKKDQGYASILQAGENESNNFVSTSDPATQAAVAGRYGSIIDNAVATGGISATHAEELKQQWHAKTAEAVIQRDLTNGDIDHAQKFYEANKSALPITVQSSLERTMRGEVLRKTADDNAQAILAGKPIPAQSSGDVSTNPFNLGNVKTAHGASTGTAEFAQPASPLDGVILTANTLRSGYQGLTLAQIGAKWAPSSENKTGDWVSNVSRASGLTPDSIPDLNDPAQLQKLITGIATAEKSPKDRALFNSDIIAQGAAAAITGAKPTLNQTAPATAPIAPEEATKFEPGATPEETLLNLDKIYPAALSRANAIPNLDQREATLKALEQKHQIYAAGAQAWKTQFNNQAQNLAVDPHFTDISQIPPDMRSALADNPLTMQFLEKRAYYNLKNTGNMVSVDKAEFGSGFYDNLSKVYAPPSSPGAITSADQLYKAEVAGQITPAGFERLKKEIDAKSTPEGQAALQMKGAMFNTARSQITSTNPTTGIKDARGDQLFTQWSALALANYDSGIKNGKTPAQLLTPDSPDYVGNTIGNFKRSTNQQVADMLKDAGSIATEQRTLPAIYADIKSGKISKADGRAEAEKLGLVAPQSPSVPRPE